MKLCKKSFSCGVRLYQVVLTAILFAGLAVQSEATVYTISSTANGITYSASYDSSLNALTAWSANGANQLGSQSLFYSVNGGSVSQLLGPSVVVNGPTSLTAAYSVSGIASAADTITLNGNTLVESIKVKNLSSSAATLSLFQYSDFILGNALGGQTLNMTVLNSSQSTANQSGGGIVLQWGGQLTGGAVEVQASNGGVPFGPFNGTATALNNAPLSVFGNAVFGYEFDSINLGAGNSFTASETATLMVPEPSSSAVIALGMFAAATLFCTRRKGSVIAN